MSFDDYASHIYQKLRLAVALAIIRSKPANKPTVEYLNDLKSKMDDKMEDDDVTVCSDDFLMDEDDLNVSADLLKDFNLQDLDDNVLEADDNTNLGKDNAVSAQPINLDDDLTQMTIFESSQIVTPNTNNPQNNITLYVEHGNENSKNLLKETKNIDSHHKNQESKITLHDSYHNSVPIESNTAKIDSTYYDSQKTILYSVHGFTDNYTHYSPSQTDMIIPQKYIYGVKEKRNIKYTEITKPNAKDDSLNYHKESSINNIKDTVENPQIIKEIEFSQNRNVFSQNIDDNFSQMQEIYIDNNANTNNIALSTVSTKNNETSFQPEVNIQNFGQFSQTTDEFFEEMQNINNDTYSNDYEKHSKGPQCINMENTEETLIFSQNNNIFSQNIHDISNKNNFETDYSQNINKPTLSNNLQVNTKNIVLYNMDTKTINSNLDSYKNQESEFTQESNKATFEKIDSSFNDSQNRNVILHNIDENNDFEDCSKEIVSYKVLEEFNKVKNYLIRNRRLSCDGYSTDSGYRSDSQIRSSNRSALQLTDNWLNQSACCLFNYLMQCPLVAATRDITNEIAQILSQLIDKLHEEEKYPSFLEDLFETIDLLLKQIYRGSSSENEFLTADENMQRILLLNKSIHIQQHTIEKISNILETFHSKVTEKDTTYELTNIDEIENVSYIFHILEILLKKYLQNKDKFSQYSTQNSQDEDKILKKSSITDIWRKKWNPSQKVFEGSKEKKCVLKVCSEVLNKIVVDCVSSYSLVAYSALKCFNSMQS